MDALDAPELLAVDDGVWVFAKPVGWVAHATRDDEPFDLREWAVRQHGAPPAVAPAHRLDRDTSGVVLYAEGARLGELGRAFADRSVTKRYLALVYGRAHRKGIVRRPLDGAAAVTRYRTLEWIGPFSLLEVRPETGRKHQIRRHLQSVGHAVVGDPRWRPPRPRRVPAHPGRMWLHAASIALPDGRRWEAPLPAALAAHLDALRAAADRSRGVGLSS